MTAGLSVYLVPVDPCVPFFLVGLTSTLKLEIQVPLKCWWPSTKLRSVVIFEKNVILILRILRSHEASLLINSSCPLLLYKLK